ncbi:DNA replication protein DnaC [Brevibacillus aydinogluensis]|jgi:DNA replication protein DnaC|uniref:IS21-like element helper ATPase IstB n=1 Tax=Bacillales TaxID=1385 RepID=UPI000E39D0FB|nr:MULTISPECIES: IS21-like element helper ATPase IstB [Bacillales]MBR8661832.1 IS21-like element helper ATPase IstB [Brevibacillus sp. NL20B1]MBS2773235.1 IS21-like element helper ATPase IstB [Anoxybacillus rupiensis]MDT3417387.1 DNA replication protein DnaC [Brevibacillus aydinogluensis]REK67792.1 MAG: AAA family ATPase [Brevibacillus sp.]
MIELEQARLRLEELGLQQAALLLDAHLEAASHGQPTYLSFLNMLLDAEIAERQKRNMEVRTKLAHLPYRKTLEEFDFSFQPSIDERMIRELATMTFVTRHENVLFLGPPGVGKSHLSVALAVEAISQGISVYFVSLSQLIEDLRKAYAENRLDKRLRIYIRPKLLIIDEIGYLPFDSLAANLFFQVVSARYERGSILLTSNKSFGEWGELMGDPILATAILDRLLHHSHIVNIRGNSYRLREKMRTGAYGSPSST